MFDDIFSCKIKNNMEVFDLKRFRSDKKITQAELTTVLDCRQSFISAIESGKRALPKDKRDILENKYGDISDYITAKEDTILQGITPQEMLYSGADAFSRQVVKMMNDKLIAPYGMLTEKEKEIEKLNRQIGRLEAELEAARKTGAQEDK